MASYTLATLKSAIQDEIEDQGEEFEDHLESIISQAEDACIVDLDLTIFNDTGTVSTVQGTQTASMPTGFLRVKSLFYTAASTRTFLEERSYEYCIDYAPSTATQSAPLFFAHLNTTQLFFAPVPDAIYACTAFGVKRPTSLISENSGTWLSQKAGDLLFKQCLIQAEIFAKADERVPVRREEYAGELVRKHFEFKHLRNPEYELGQDAEQGA